MLNVMYKEFLDYKVKSIKSYINVLKKIRSIEDLKFTLGLCWFCLTKIIFKPKINNETIRGR